MSQFQIGQLVCCVYAGPWYAPIEGEALPVKARVYTVRDTKVDLGNTASVFHGIRLAEIVNPVRAPRSEECWFDARAFRPLVDSRLDIFRKALAPVPVVRVPIVVKG